MTKITEDAIEQTTLKWLENLGYEIAYGPDITFAGPSPERDAEALPDGLNIHHGGQHG